MLQHKMYIPARYAGLSLLIIGSVIQFYVYYQRNINHRQNTNYVLSAKTRIKPKTPKTAELPKFQPFSFPPTLFSNSPEATPCSPSLPRTSPATTVFDTLRDDLAAEKLRTGGAPGINHHSSLSTEQKEEPEHTQSSVRLVSSSSQATDSEDMSSEMPQSEETPVEETNHISEPYSTQTSTSLLTTLVGRATECPNTNTKPHHTLTEATIAFFKKGSGRTIAVGSSQRWDASNKNINTLAIYMMNLALEDIPEQIDPGVRFWYLTVHASRFSHSHYFTSPKN
ncbi:hypothetical protein NEDG_01570 [Nematocida displodere]|uniref:Uncharacterized protein n=1 Tax=Nematocida displodere TaxID=1805483 RepID=A0A177EGT2_9MICR|nr:hypothetical protein NEDG_01570 [Nematocida displodere]